MEKELDLYILVDGEIVKFDACIGFPGMYTSPEGFCRIIDDNGKKCSCTVISTLGDSSCPCAPHQKAPICKKEKLG